MKLHCDLNCEVIYCICVCSCALSAVAVWVFIMSATVQWMDGSCCALTYTSCVQVPRVELTLSELQEMATRQQQQIEAQQQMLVAKVTCAQTLRPTHSFWMDSLSISVRLSTLESVWKGQQWGLGGMYVWMLVTRHRSTTCDQGQGWGNDRKGHLCYYHLQVLCGKQDSRSVVSVPTFRKRLLSWQEISSWQSHSCQEAEPELHSRKESGGRASKKQRVCFHLVKCLHRLKRINAQPPTFILPISRPPWQRFFFSPSVLCWYAAFS